MFKNKVFVVRVVDGDTIVVRFEDGKEESLRLIGVDTPETKDPRKPMEYFGQEAYNFTKRKLEGKYVTLEQNLESYKDAYNRLLGYVYVDDLLFNKYLIEYGYARAYLKYPFKYSVDFEKAQSYAKRYKLGMWGDSDVKKEIVKEFEAELDSLFKLLEGDVQP